VAVRERPTADPDPSNWTVSGLPTGVGRKPGSGQLSGPGQAHEAAECAELLSAAGIPVGPILTVPETVAHPQGVARVMVVALPHPTEGTVRTLGSRSSRRTRHRTCGTPAPPHRQHTAEVLADVDLTPGEIARLRDQGSIRG